MRPLGLDTGTLELEPTDSGEVPLRGLELTTVEPEFGTERSVVTVVGGPFEQGDAFTVNGVDAAVLTLTETEAELEIPDLPTEGWFELRVHPADAPDEPQALAFRYFASAEGSHGAIGLVARYAHVGGYWPSDVVDYASAEVVFPVGPAGSYGGWQYSPTLDSCALDHVPPPLALYDTGLTRLTFKANDDASTEYILDATGGERFALDQGAIEWIPSGPPSDLTPTKDSRTDWPAFSVPGFVGEIDSGFVVTQPSIMAGTNPRVAAEFTLNWGGPFDGEVLLTLVRKRWNPDQSRYDLQETITCWLVDDGEHTVPDLWTEWAPFPSAGLRHDAVDFVVGRVKSSEAILPHNQGLSGVLGGVFIIGNAVAE